MQILDLNQKANLNRIRSNLKSHTIFRTNTTKAQNSYIKNQLIFKKYSFNQNLNFSDAQTQIWFKENDIQTGQSFQNKYLILEKLGQGSNGIVKKCKQLKTGMIYAVKISSVEEEHILNLKKGFKIVKNLNHSNIVKYKQMYIHMRKHKCYLIMEYVPYPSLRKFKNIKQKDIKSIIRQLLKILQYLHSQSLCHRDIKPDNLLYDQINKKIILIDFGISHKIAQRHKKYQMWSRTGTLSYKAPQMLTGGAYDLSVDTWAVGVILFQLIQGKTPFYNQSQLVQINKIVNIQYTFDLKKWKDISKFSKDLVQKLLRYKNKRFNPIEALRTIWFLQDDRKDMPMEQLDDGFLLLSRKNTKQQQKQYQYERMLSVNTDSKTENYILQQILRLRQKQDDIIIITQQS